MKGLLDTADVREGDGNWTAGGTADAVQSGMESLLSDICLPAPAEILAGTHEGSPSGYATKPFSFVVRMRYPTKCGINDPDTFIREAVRLESEKAVGHALWFGTGSSETWLGASGVGSVAAGATIQDSVGAALEEFYRRTVGLEPIVHLGVTSALKLGQYIDETPSLRGTNTRVVVSPGYPADGIAVTGPVEIQLSGIQSLLSRDWRVNREVLEGTRIGSVEFDPAAAVIVGEPPIQTYISHTATALEVQALVDGNEAIATIDWGDASADSNVAAGGGTANHTYAAAGQYTVTITHNGADRTVTINV